MKKKFLSLMMAAAVVATTSVSAFAADNVDASVENPEKANVTDEDNQDRTTEVTITGKVADQTGNMPAASFKVTVPTAANFTVTENGFFGPSLKIKNEGPQAIEVYAQRFARAEGGSGDIKTVTEDAIKTDTQDNHRYDRSSVALKLKGEIFDEAGKESVAFLAAKDDGGSGIYSNEDLGTPAETGIKLLALGAGNTRERTGTIKLDGVAGKGQVSNGAKSDKFQLTLRIKKASN